MGEVVAMGCYNTSLHSSIKCSPYQALYGKPPPTLLSYIPGQSKLDKVNQFLHSRDFVLKELKFQLARVQDRMKYNYNRKRKEIELKKGDEVDVKLQPYRQHVMMAGRIKNHP